MKRLLAGLVTLASLSGVAHAAPMMYLNAPTPLICGGATPHEQVQVSFDNQCGDQISVHVDYNRPFAPPIQHHLFIPMGASFDAAMVIAPADIVSVVVTADNAYAACFGAKLVGDVCF
jgi:hypothetical protein